MFAAVVQTREQDVPCAELDRQIERLKSRIASAIADRADGSGNEPLVSYARCRPRDVHKAELVAVHACMLVCADLEACMGTSVAIDMPEAAISAVEDLGLWQ